MFHVEQFVKLPLTPNNNVVHIKQSVHLTNHPSYRLSLISHLFKLTSALYDMP